MLSSSAAFAQTRSALAPGVYAGASLGRSAVSNGCGVVPAGVACDDQSATWKVLAGYQLNPHFGVEAGYGPLVDRDSGTVAGPSTTRSNALEFVGTGGNMLTPNFGVYAKLGFYTARTKVSASASNADETTSNVTWGVGARYDFSRSVAARAEWQRYERVGVDAIGYFDVTVLSIGAIYKF